MSSGKEFRSVWHMERHLTTQWNGRVKRKRVVLKEARNSTSFVKGMGDNGDESVFSFQHRVVCACRYILGGV